MTPAVAVLLLLVGCGSSDYRSPADDQADYFADTSLHQHLQEGLRNSPPDARLEVVLQRLQEPGRDFMGSNSDLSWVVGAVDGSSVEVTVYYHWQDTTFFPSGDWGVACREYTVLEVVVVRAVDCADGTPERPGPDGVGWYYR